MVSLLRAPASWERPRVQRPPCTPSPGRLDYAGNPSCTERMGRTELPWALRNLTGAPLRVISPRLSLCLSQSQSSPCSSDFDNRPWAPRGMRSNATGSTLDLTALAAQQAEYGRPPRPSQTFRYCNLDRSLGPELPFSARHMLDFITPAHVWAHDSPYD